VGTWLDRGLPTTRFSAKIYFVLMKFGHKNDNYYIQVGKFLQQQKKEDSSHHN